MLNLNTINRIALAYGRVIRRQVNRPLNSVDLLQSIDKRHPKQDRRQLSDRRRKTVPVILNRRTGKDRRHSKRVSNTADAAHSIDIIA